MKFIVFILFILSLFVAPFSVFADCNKVGVTVVFVNGIFSTEASATADKDSLRDNFKNIAKLDNVNFIMGYNSSHVGGLDDLATSVIQAYTGGYLDHDLTDILRQVHADLKTQRVILVGHSQGTFYTNAAYDYLVGHGVDKNSIVVYNIGTPADRVAGNGKYLTSSTDEVINTIVRDLVTAGFAKKPLPANIDIKIPNIKGVDYEDGHSFSQVYLGLAPDRVIGDMDNEMAGLTATSDKNECFVQPDIGTMYRVWDEGYQLADSFGKYSNYAATSSNTPAQMASIANTLFQGVYNFGKQVTAGISNVLAQTESLGASISSSFNQKSVNSLPVVSNVPSVQITAIPPAVVENVPAPQVISLQDQLDDIQEKLDIISQQVQTLIAQQNPTIQLAVAQIPQQLDDKNDPDKDNNQDNNQNTTKVNKSSGGGGGGGSMIYPKILISEVQIEPIGQRFVELYNPNSTDINLTGWYLQRKDANDTSWGSLVSSTNFANRIIPATGYLLISKEIFNLDTFTLSDNNYLALKNPNEDISDQVSWSQITDGLSSGRRWDLTSGTEQNFELQTPTPGLQNITYATPVIPSPVILKNILISEIQIEGETVNDDWVELYNPNIDPVSLSGWSIQTASINGKISHIKNFEVGSEILGKNYFLIVRSSANQKLLALADMTCSGLELSSEFASGNTVYLVKKQEIITDGNDTDIVDKVGYGMAKDFEVLPAIRPSAGQTGQSMGRIWDEVLQEYKNTENNNADFEIDTPTPKVQNVGYMASVSTPPPALTDTTPPQASFSIDATQTSLTFPVNFTITDPLVGTVSPSGIGSYVFQWQAQGDTSWNTDDAVQVNGNPTSKTFIRSFTGQNGTTYNFQVQATDAATPGNVSVWFTTTIKISLVQKILINEVQIAGADNYQDFIELYNPSSKDTVYLKGYRLVSRLQSSTEDTSIKSWTDADSKILPGQYYLWASSHDPDYPASINADVSTSPNISINSGIGLRYGSANTGQIIDAVGWGTFNNVLFEKMAVENPMAGQSIQRRWDSTINEPRDTNDNSADFGLDIPTPRAQNIVYYVPPPVDKTALELAINNATTLLADTYIGPEIGKVSQPAHDSYNNAIIAAQAVDSNSTATQTEADTAKSNLDAATVIFDGSMITSADQDAAQVVMTKIESLSHGPIQLPVTIADDGTITDFMMPDFGYNTIIGDCNTTYDCVEFMMDGFWDGESMGVNNKPGPYLFSSWLPLSVQTFLGTNYHHFVLYFRSPFPNYFLCYTLACPTYMDHVMYYMSFDRNGDDPNKGWTANSFHLDDTQTVADATTAYNALTPTQQALVVNYPALQSRIDSPLDNITPSLSDIPLIEEIPIDSTTSPSL